MKLRSVARGMLAAVLLAQVVRERQRSARQVEDLALYWRDVVAARRVHRLPDTGPARSVIDTMLQLAFAIDELAAARRLLGVAEGRQAIEKVAFAATQGLYARRTAQFVSGGKPDPEYAVHLVHTGAHERARVKAAFLAITDRLLQRMGGRLEVYSEPGRGSRFTVRLARPLASTPARQAVLALLLHLGANTSARARHRGNWPRWPR